MYTMSEMAGLMEDVCSKFAKKIAVLWSYGRISEYYMKIHTAKFTSTDKWSFFFKTNAKLYIEAQKKLYSDLEDQKKKCNAVELMFVLRVMKINARSNS
jgi:hypothetical protein